MSPPSPVPVRYPSGVSTDFPYGPLANFGLPNPLSYHVLEDDFDVLNPQYVITKTTGTAALVAGDGGLVELATAATANDLTSLQGPIASFSFTAGKKSFFLARLKVDSATLAEFNVGLMNVTATPFAPTDGLYFKKAAGATTLVLASMVGSVETDIAIAAANNPLADATSIDLAWFVDRKQNVYAFVAGQLVGYQSQNSAALGPMASGTPTLTGANLALTLAVGTAAAVAHNMTVDFMLAAKER